MKNIRKLKAAAGTALMVGATLTGAAGFAAAQDSNSDTTLGDYPQPFVDDQGNVDSTIVVGSQGKQADVVGAINIAGSLGNAAYKTEQKSAPGTAAGWSATSGVTLDTRNDQLYFNDNINSVRKTLTGEHLSALKDYTFRDDSGDKTDIEFYLYPGTQQVKFGNNVKGLNNQDPAIYVPNPSNVGTSGSQHLFQLQANFEDQVDFTSKDVQGQEITLFGNTYTVSQDTTPSELILYGSSQEVSIDSGNSKTVTVNGEEHSFEVVSVTSSNTTAVRVNGKLNEYDEEESFTLSGQTVRIDSIIQTSNQNSEGVVSFAIGSEELRLQNGQAIEDGDGNDIDGTHVTVSNSFSSTSTLNVYVGSNNDDKQYLAAGEGYSHPLFNDFNVKFGGLNPDASQGESDIEVSTNGENTVTASFSSGGDSSSAEFIYADSNGQSLADSDQDSIVAVEGKAVTESEHLVTDAGDFSHYWEVSNVDRDSNTASGSISSGDEATVQLKDKFSGQSVEVDLSPDGSQNDYVGTEVIDGQTYHFHLDGSGSTDSAAELYVAWGTDASATDTGVNTGGSASGVTTAFPSIETDSGARVAFYDPSQSPTGLALGTTLYDITTGENLYWNDAGNDGDIGSNDDLWIDNDDYGTYEASGRSISTQVKDAFTVVDGSNDQLAVTLDGGSTTSTVSVIDNSDVTSGQTLTGSTLATDIQNALNSAGSESFTVSYDQASDSFQVSTAGGVSGDTTVSAAGSASLFSTAGFSSSKTVETQTPSTADNTRTDQFVLADTVNEQITFTPDGGTNYYTVDVIDSTANDYNGGVVTGSALATDIQQAMNNAQTTESYTVSYSSTNDQFSIADDGTEVSNSSIDWDGTNGNSTLDLALNGASIASDSSSGDSTTIFSSNNNVAFNFIDGVNDVIKLTEDEGSTTVTADLITDGGLSNGVSTDGPGVASAIQSAAGTVGSETYSVDYGTTSADKFTIASNGGVSGATTLLWTDAASTSANTLGFSTADDDTVQTTPSATSDNPVAFNVVSGSNDDITVSVDGSSTEYSIAAGDYTGSELATELESKIGSSSVTVDYGTSNTDSFTILSDSTGLGSSVTVTSGTNDITPDIGFSSPTERTGDAVQYGSPSTESTTGSEVTSSSYLKSPSDSFTNGDTIVEDNDGSSDYTADDEIVGASASGNVQYWSSDAEETSGVSGLQSILPTSNPAMVVIEEEDDSDVQESYTVTASWDSGDSEVNVNAPTFTDSSKRSTSQLESDTDVTAGYDVFGTYTEHDSDGQGSVSFSIPNAQATVGAAVTGADGSLSASGGTGSVKVNTPTGFPNAAQLDKNVDRKSASNLIMVGGPAVNTLVQDLAKQNKTWTADQYSQDTWILDLVEGFTQDQHALVVAGHSAQDTRAASQFLANYQDNQDKLAGKSRVSMTTSSSSQ